MIHCWAQESDQYEFGSMDWADCVNRGDGTCMLEEGHIGNHEFVSDDEIVVELTTEYLIGKIGE